jgi:hypothetical protein
VALRQARVSGHLEAVDETTGGNARMRQLADLADDLVAQIGSVGEQYEQLQRTLEEPTLPGGQAQPPSIRVAEEPASGPGETNEYGPSIEDSVRLVVMDMALKGSSRDQTKAYLHDVFGIEDGDVLVDAIFDDCEANGSRRRRFTRA